MTQEEKAKAYDEAIKRAKNCLDEKRDACLVRPDVIFPELQESEDEKIRKMLIKFFGKGAENDSSTNGISDKDIVAWLEKQGEPNPYSGVSFTYNGHTWGMCARDNGVDILLDEQLFKHLEKQGEQILANSAKTCKDEQKPADKVEPKFKVGDWVVQGHNILKIKCVGNSRYCFETVGGYVDDMLVSEIDSQFHLWTIEDAKDSDVLAFYSEYRGNKMVQVGIIEKYVGKHGGCSNTFKIYVGVNWDNNLQIGDYMGCSDILPAIKEQRDILYKAMADAGYAFDFVKKKLKKIEKKPSDKVEPKFKVGDWVIDNCDCVWKIEGILNQFYILEDIEGCESRPTIEWVDKTFHLWTIEDAKDGDVLVGNEEDVILMFRGIGNARLDDVIDYHCYYDCNREKFIVQKDLEFWGHAKDTQLEPATKEQCDLLFQKMKEAGYECDADGKENKKIHTELEECKIEHIEHGKYYYCIKDYFCGGKKQASKGDVVQALRGMSIMSLGTKANEYFLPVNFIKYISAWSEEDEANFNEALSYIKDDALKEFIKSLKQRIGG